MGEVQYLCESKTDGGDPLVLVLVYKSFMEWLLFGIVVKGCLPPILGCLRLRLTILPSCKCTPWEVSGDDSTICLSAACMETQMEFLVLNLIRMWLLQAFGE